MNEFIHKNYTKNEKINIMRFSKGKVLNEIRKAGALAQMVYDSGVDCYMSMNPLVVKNKCIKRDKEHVGRLKWLYVDLDFYNSCYKDFTKRQIIGLLELDYFGQGIPVPTYIVDSGRGLYLLWRLDEHIKAYPRWVKMQKYLAEQLQEFGADKKVVSDSARVLRKIGSINSKTGTKVQIVWNQDVKYSLTNLVREYLIGDTPSEKMLRFAKHIARVLGISFLGNTRSEVKDFIENNKDAANVMEHKQKEKQYKKDQKKIVRRIGNERSLLSGRIEDLEKLLINYRDKENGCREHILFLYRYWQICITDSMEEGLRRTMELNDRLNNPLDKQEVINATASAEKYYLAGKVFRCSNTYVIDALHITSEEMKELSVFIDSAEYAIRKQERNRKAYLETLKKLGKCSKEEQIKQRRRMIEKLLRKGKTVQEICTKMNISRATFYADKHQIELYLAAKKEKQKRRMAKYAEYSQVAKDRCLKISAFVLYMSFRTCPLVFSPVFQKDEGLVLPPSGGSVFLRQVWRDWGAVLLRQLSYSSFLLCPI